MAVKWRRRKEARPQEILAAALTTFVEHGYAATRLEDVARRAGVTKGTLYLYFPNKEELFKAVIRDTLVPTLASIGAMSGVDPIAALLATFQRLADTPVGALPKLVLGEAANFPEIAHFYLDEVVTPGLAAIRVMLRRQVRAGNFRKIDVNHAAYCVIGPLLLAMLWQHSLGPVAKRPLNVAALIRAHHDLLLNGLLANR